MSGNQDGSVPASQSTPLEHKSHQTVIDRLLQQGISAAEAGDKGWARRCFHRVLTLEDNNEDAWLWLAVLAPTPKGSKAYFKQALLLHPNSTAAREGIAWAEKRMRERGIEDTLRRSPSPEVSDQLTPPPEKTRPLPDMRASIKTLGSFLHRWRAVLLPVLLCLAALLGSFWVARTGRAVWARRANPSTSIPTPIPTATPSPEEQVASLWFQADEAWNREDWDKAISILEEIRGVTPSDPQARLQLSSAYMHSGLELLEHNRIEQAIVYFDRAIRLNANDEALQQARRSAIRYLPGRDSYRQGDWQLTIDRLAPIFREDPSYLDTGLMLCEAYYQQGLSYEQREELEEAREAYRMAMVANPNSVEAQQRFAIVTDIIKSRKRIEVDVSQQHFTAWENEEVVFSFKCSTGRYGTPTKYGTFKVLDKIPQEAYSSAWGLRMPWWLGIYWAGASENGIHALPILSNGQTLWSGYLGTPISFGCIVLDTYAAKQVYDWAEIGTIVEVHP
ncbi:MAG: L,D-transpeptidase family protein [Anaerolineae bacterium]|nr:L,D-transpeptidase family protein [Anaerolineae bacterium]